jgi:hypothetical protein
MIVLSMTLIQKQPQNYKKNQHFVAVPHRSTLMMQASPSNFSVKNHDLTGNLSGGKMEGTEGGGEAHWNPMLLWADGLCHPYQ